MSDLRIAKPWSLCEAKATPEAVFLHRREILAGLGLAGLALALPPWLLAASPAPRTKLAPALGSRFADRFPARRNPAYTIGDRPITSEDVAGSFNNFYELTTEKERVWELARAYRLPDPWKIEVAGLVRKPRTLDLDFLFKTFPLEERLYRFRCVERWAMQVPWTGFPLRALIDALEPLSTARYVRFTSLLDKQNLPGQREAGWYLWPYYEGLRLDEARHELAFVATGSYGHALPMQHGAPLRLVLPWKYGYKGPKSIVRIELVADLPRTFWNDSQPTEYGFYSNVDPGKPHPRWSQSAETDIGTGQRRPTLPYNGYAELVGSMYDGKER